MAKKTEVMMKIIDAALDEAASWAREHPQEGVNLVIHMIDAAQGDPVETKRIMDGAAARGFVCEFWPSNGGMSIRVQWWGK